MSFAYLPLYTGDYIRDTRHLSCCEHGVYILLLVHCWDQQGPLPLDEKKIAGICGARSGDEVEAMRRILQEFFVKMEDGFYNRRMQREVERANAISLKRKSAGSKGFQAKAKHLPSKSQASATTLTPTPILSLTPTSKESKTLSGKPDVAMRVLQFLNDKTGRQYRPVKANLEMICARIKDGATETELCQVIAKKCREWTGDEKMAIYLRPATLFNRTKFAQYQGELLCNVQTVE